jgi:hypothetical protein
VGRGFPLPNQACPAQSATVGEEKDTVKRRKQPAKKTPPKAPPLNLSGIKFEDELHIILNTPPLREPTKQKNKRVS